MANGHLPAGEPRLFNRELSWLDFNGRVLAFAEDPSVPLLERAKFLAIFSENLDELFQVRVAGLKEQVAAGITASTPDGRTPAEQLSEIRIKTLALLRRAEALFLDQISPGLAHVGIRFSSWPELDDDDRKWLVEEFEQRIFPVLTPLAVDPGHPFPYISNLSLNLAVIAREPGGDGPTRFARVKVPPAFPRFLVMPDGERWVPLEQVIAEHLDMLFPGMHVLAHVPFRVTRNADLSLEDEEADDLLAAVETELRRRRFGAAVRLEVATEMEDELRSMLVQELDLGPEDVYEFACPLDLAGLWTLHGLDRPDLKYEPYLAATPPRLQPREDEQVDVFSALAAGDVMVHHPYDSFSSTVEEFIHQAAHDPRVRAIKLTLYRTGGRSTIVESLIRAAERGKEVAVLVELKARFDEQANIEWAKTLEKAGVHVVYGLIGLKTHAKIALVVREEGGRMRRYCHVGTGNYNATTARVYEDLGLLTADTDLGLDLTQLFNYLTGFSQRTTFRRLVQAPFMLRDRMTELIEREREHGADGRIVAKMNALVDPDIIESLYAAAGAGVQIDLIVRGICCLRPGVPGLSDTIRVRSIVGRYLEHSRIYRFANGAGPGEPLYYVGSADMMPRNLDRRVEALIPVTDPEIRRRLDEILAVNLADNQLAWALDGDGSWHQVPPGPGEPAVDTHTRLESLALERAG